MSVIEQHIERTRRTAALLDAKRSVSASVRLRRGDEIELRAVEWLWPRWIALGKLHILAGKPGTGKTTLALAMAATITRGGLWPDGSHAKRGTVVIWSGEDDPEDTLAPRLHAAGADMQHVRFVQGAGTAADPRPFDPATDMPLLSEALSELPDVRLLLLDPIVSAVAGDSHKSTEVRRSLQPIADLCMTRRCAALGISHLSKGTTGREPLERVIGSQAFGAVARVVMFATKQADESGEPRPRLICIAKSNIGPDGGGIEYEIRQGMLADHPGMMASHIEWGRTVEGEARELLAAAEGSPSDEEDTGERTDARRFLRMLLEVGPMPAKQVFAEADGAGYSKAQMQRAARALKIDTRKDGMKSGWTWRLPETRREGCEDDEDHAKDDTSPSASPSQSSQPSTVWRAGATCAECVNFEPDPINPAGGLGGCALSGRRLSPAHAACTLFGGPHEKP
jgi:putative DNA primase/helicase